MTQVKCNRIAMVEKSTSLPYSTKSYIALVKCPYCHPYRNDQAFIEKIFTGCLLLITNVSQSQVSKQTYLLGKFLNLRLIKQKRGQWLWLSWQSGRLRHQRSLVQIWSSANFYQAFVYCELKKRPGIVHFLKKNMSTKSLCLIGCLLLLLSTWYMSQTFDKDIIACSCLMLNNSHINMSHPITDHKLTDSSIDKSNLFYSNK